MHRTSVAQDIWPVMGKMVSKFFETIAHKIEDARRRQGVERGNSTNKNMFVLNLWTFFRCIAIYGITDFQIKWENVVSTVLSSRSS